MRRRVHVLAALACILLLGGCTTGKKPLIDADKARRKCKWTVGTLMTREQARCYARLAGLKDTRRCPLRVAEDGAIARVRETCSTIGLDLERETGRIIGVKVGDSTVYRDR